MDFFGTPWNALRLENVRDFLASAGDEGIDWETKGTELPRPEQVRKAVCGLSNQRGGFFMIGPRRGAESGEWAADGIDFTSREAGTWISEVLRNGEDRLRPEPRFDVHERSTFAWLHNRRRLLPRPRLLPHLLAAVIALGRL